MTGMLTAADAERLRSWALDVAAALIPDAQWSDEGTERRFVNNGGLLINRASGAWFSHSAGKGGYSAISLISHLRPEWHTVDAIACAAAFLAAHPGTGACTGSPDDADSEATQAASRAEAEWVLRNMAPVGGTPAAAYLRSRGLVPPWPACLGYLPDARCGEGALVGILTAHERTVGVQIGYLDPDGVKSLVLPQRRRFMLEKAPGAVFEVRSDGPGRVCTTEGLEDALSVAMAVPGPVWGVPGIGGLAHLDIAKGASVLVVQDGDAAGSPAAEAAIRGVDHLILGGATVSLTDTPQGEDANSILRTGGIDALRALIAETKRAELSLDGDVERLARLEPVEYDRARIAVAKRQACASALLVIS